jgi:hypothetical protein
MEYLVEGTDVLSKNELQKIRAGQECQAVCGVHCSLKIIICWLICRQDSVIDNDR